MLPPERVMASGNDVVPAIVYSGELTRRQGYYVYLETLGGGSGARFDADGMDAVHVHMTNTSNLPAEARDLEGIWLYTLEEWGIEQAHRYTDELTAAFDQLANKPQLGTSCDYIRKGYRRSRVARACPISRSRRG